MDEPGIHIKNRSLGGAQPTNFMGNLCSQDPNVRTSDFFLPLFALLDPADFAVRSFPENQNLHRIVPVPFPMCRSLIGITGNTDILSNL